MSNNLLEVAYAEYKHWMGEVLKTEEYQKVKSLESLIKTFGGTIPNIDKNPLVEVTITPARQSVTQIDNGSSIKEQVITLCTQGIRESGGYAHKAALTEYVNKRGLDMKANTLGWYLSHEKGIFAPNRTKGWSLREDNKTNAVVNENISEAEIQELFA